MWTYPGPGPGALDLRGLLAFSFDAVDEWYEEAERIGVHPRDPYHRIDVVDSDRHVTVRVGGQVVADSHRPVVLFETGLPPRYYLPEEDVAAEVLEPSPTVTECPYKGTTSRYWSIRAGGEHVEDAIWVYDEVHAEAKGIEGRLAFYQEKVDLTSEVEPWSTPTGR